MYSVTLLFKPTVLSWYMFNIFSYSYLPSPTFFSDNMAIQIFPHMICVVFLFFFDFFKNPVLYFAKIFSKSVPHLQKFPCLMIITFFMFSFHVYLKSLQQRQERQRPKVTSEHRARRSAWTILAMAKTKVTKTSISLLGLIRPCQSPGYSKGPQEEIVQKEISAQDEGGG